MADRFLPSSLFGGKADILARDPHNWRYRDAGANLITQWITNWEDIYMPRKYQNQKNDSHFNTWFVGLRLNENDRENFEVWLAENVDRFDSCMALALEAGLKLSISYSEENSGFCASHTCKDTQSRNYGGVLTSWGSTWDEAVWLNFYKVFSLLDNKSWPKQEERVNWG